MRLAPRFRRLRSMIHCSSTVVTFTVGDLRGRLLAYLSPSNPSVLYRFHHFLSVGRDIQHLLHTRPASCVVLYIVTQHSRCFLALLLTRSCIQVQCQRVETMSMNRTDDLTELDGAFRLELGDLFPRVSQSQKDLRGVLPQQRRGRARPAGGLLEFYRNA